MIESEEISIDHLKRMGLYVEKYRSWRGLFNLVSSDLNVCKEARSEFSILLDKCPIRGTPDAWYISQRIVPNGRLLVCLNLIEIESSITPSRISLDKMNSYAELQAKLDDSWYWEFRLHVFGYGHLTEIDPYRAVGFEKTGLCHATTAK